MWKRYREPREYHLYEAYKRQCNKAQIEMKNTKRYVMGEVITDSIEAANLLNDHFASVYTDEEIVIYLIL